MDTVRQLTADQALRQLESFRETWFQHVRPKVQMPEPGLVLKLAERRGDETRMVKHLQQMCAFNFENFALANKIKHLYLVDAFRTLAHADNPVALFAVARGMLELSAFLHEVQRRLAQSVVQNPNSWLPLAEKYFGVIIRARCATTDPALRDVLLAEGVSPKRLDPFNVMECVRGLASEPGYTDSVERYGVLCDSVHHNLGSTSHANSGTGVGDAARFEGGGRFVSNGQLTFTQYEFPVAGKTERALELLSPGFLFDALACVDWLNLTPGTPFSPEFLEATTGHPLGLVEVAPPQQEHS